MRCALGTAGKRTKSGLFMIPFLIIAIIIPGVGYAKFGILYKCDPVD